MSQKPIHIEVAFNTAMSAEAEERLWSELFMLLEIEQPESINACSSDRADDLEHYEGMV